MNKSTPLQEMLGILADCAAVRGYSDTEWAERAGLRKETLSRLRHRESCDFATLRRLADSVGARLGVIDQRTPVADDSGHFPARLDRPYEERLVDLCASGTLDARRWVESGPKFFVAGLAVMLASVASFDRARLMALADELHPGASEPAVFARWLRKTPLRAARFLPQVQAARSAHGS